MNVPKEAADTRKGEAELIVSRSDWTIPALRTRAISLEDVQILHVLHIVGQENCDKLRFSPNSNCINVLLHRFLPRVQLDDFDAVEDLHRDVRYGYDVVGKPN